VTVAPGSIDTVAGGSPRLDGADGAPAATASLAAAGVAMAVSGDRLYLDDQIGHQSVAEPG